MLDRFLGQQGLLSALLDAGFQRRTHDIVEEKGAVDEEGEAEDLKPFERLQMKRVRQVSMVARAVALTVLVTDRPKKLKPPMLIMMRIEETAMARFWVISRHPSTASK